MEKNYLKIENSQCTFGNYTDKDATGCTIITKDGIYFYPAITVSKKANMLSRFLLGGKLFQFFDIIIDKLIRRAAEKKVDNYELNLKKIDEIINSSESDLKLRELAQENTDFAVAVTRDNFLLVNIDNNMLTISTKDKNTYYIGFGGELYDDQIKALLGLKN